MTSKRTLALAGLTMVGVLVAAGDTAEAKPRRKNARDTIELVRPAQSPDLDASGRVAIKNSKKGDRFTLKLDRLDPRAEYEVRDSATDELLATVRTNRKGKATVKLASGGGAGKSGDASGVDAVDVCEADSGRCVLTGALGNDGDGPDDLGDFAFGFGFYGSPDAHSGSVSMLSLPSDGLESFELSMSPPFGEDDTTWSVLTYHASTLEGDVALPLGVASVSELSGRAFQVVLGDRVVLEGDLPEMEDLGDPMPFDRMPYEQAPGMPEPLPMPPVWEGRDGEGDWNEWGGWTDGGGFMDGEWGDWEWGDGAWGDWEIGEIDWIDPIEGGWGGGGIWDGPGEGVPSDFVLFVADGNGDLQEVGNLTLFEFTVPEWPGVPDHDWGECPMPGDRWDIDWEIDWDIDWEMNWDMNWDDSHDMPWRDGGPALRR